MIPHDPATEPNLDLETVNEIDRRYEALIEQERSGIDDRIARLKKGELSSRDQEEIHYYKDVEGLMQHIRSGDNGVRVAAIMWQKLADECRKQAQDSLPEMIAEGLRFAGLPARQALIECCKRVVRLDQQYQSALDKADWHEKCMTITGRIDTAIAKLVHQLVKAGKLAP